MVDGNGNGMVSYTEEGGRVVRMKIVQRVLNLHKTFSLSLLL